MFNKTVTVISKFSLPQLLSQAFKPERDPEIEEIKNLVLKRGKEIEELQKKNQDLNKKLLLGEERINDLEKEINKKWKPELKWFRDSYQDWKTECVNEKAKTRKLEVQLASIVEESEQIKTRFVIAKHGDVDTRDDKHYSDVINQICSEIRQMVVKYFRRVTGLSQYNDFDSENSSFCRWCESRCATCWTDIQAEIVVNKKLRIALFKGFIISVLCQNIFGPIYPLKPPGISTAFQFMLGEMAKFDENQAKKWRKHYFKTLNTSDLIEREALDIEIHTQWIVMGFPFMTASNRPCVSSSVKKILSKALKVAWDARCEEGDITITLDCRDKDFSDLEKVGNHSLVNSPNIAIPCEPAISRSIDPKLAPVVLRDVLWVTFEYEALPTASENAAIEYDGDFVRGYDPMED
ncbi:hypothetical protein NEOLI_004424 [Neolecta irregularis DAH-3]|uniref:Uncharacterized protein n=1 Tax=Neolecta irregularis (strain DAH-3) TaxID=1198029 RepID=A0A1U7LUL8_NEOID|nr:hypothetical protein NEOLI_004424 [Neolecta irregularis DAH-3]|eukprot:OLL26370.1 hypothetical protein NEOLI_004424 [Neolecta irregularis DAH-3]